MSDQKKKKTTDYYIFNALFHCRVPYLDQFSKEELRDRPLPTTFIPEVDRRVMNQMVDRMLTIAQMADMFARGARIQVLNPADTKTIYQYIYDHLAAWLDYSKRTVHNVAPPLEDLEKLDALAAAVYKHARHTMMTDIHDSPLVRALRSRNQLVKKPTLKPIENMTVPNGELAEPEKQVLPEHTSMAENFSRRLPRPSGDKAHIPVTGGPKWRMKS